MKAEDKLKELKEEINDKLLKEYSFEMFAENVEMIHLSFDKFFEDLLNNEYIIDRKDFEDFITEVNHIQRLLTKYILTTNFVYDNDYYSPLYEIIPMFDFAIDDIKNLLVLKYNGKYDLDKSLDKIHNDIINELEWAQ